MTNKTMNKEFQEWLNSKGASLVVDGDIGRNTEIAIWSIFSNRRAIAVTPIELEIFSSRLGCTARQLRAVGIVESRGSGWNNSGHPTNLYERHYMFKRLGVKIASKRVVGSLLSLSNSGGYTIDSDKDGLNDSWEKLVEGAKINPVAAFESCSWGKFQVMGAWWKKLGYATVYDMVYSMVNSEAGHYEVLCRYVLSFNLAPAMRALSTSPETCRAFAKGYNGPLYAKGEYHIKLARAMQR